MNVDHIALHAEVTDALLELAGSLLEDVLSQLRPFVDRRLGQECNVGLPVAPCLGAESLGYRITPDRWPDLREVHDRGRTRRRIRLQQGGYGMDALDAGFTLSL